ncbi:MAG: hypothetical protein LBO07_03970 [Coriobacteriales bacterium]|jgi:hypothetical protein|nr:hypothetical protein [Coriobacteriales bacterium]
MSAIQFEAVVENDAIRIPEQYRNTVHGKKVHVMLLSDLVRESVDKTKAGTLTLNDFTELQLSTKGFQFDREEANARR